MQIARQFLLKLRKKIKEKLRIQAQITAHQLFEYEE